MTEATSTSVRLALVAETSEAFVNQVKLFLYSLRKNGGGLRDVPVTLVTNGDRLNKEQEDFLLEHFSPIEFTTGPRLGATRHTSKLNAFYSIDPASYDVLIFMDCDTVIRRGLDMLLDPIVKHGADFVCRRGGTTDRDRFVDFAGLVKQLCGETPGNKVLFEGREEWPMFNSGVFLATSDAVCRIRRDAVDITYRLFNRWQRRDAREALLPLFRRSTRFLYRFEALRPLFRRKIVSRQDVVDAWALEQGSLALACIRAGVEVRYLDESYNSWGGDDDFRVLHCFKSAYGFDRSMMFDGAASEWTQSYAKSHIPGQRFLAEIIEQYRQSHGS